MRMFLRNKWQNYKNSAEFLSDVEEFLKYKKEKEKKKKLIRKQFNDTLNEIKSLLKIK